MCKREFAVSRGICVTLSSVHHCVETGEDRDLRKPAAATLRAPVDKTGDSQTINAMKRNRSRAFSIISTFLCCFARSFLTRTHEFLTGKFRRNLTVTSKPSVFNSGIEWGKRSNERSHQPNRREIPRWNDEIQGRISNYSNKLWPNATARVAPGLSTTLAWPASTTNGGNMKPILNGDTVPEGTWCVR